MEAVKQNRARCVRLAELRATGRSDEAVKKKSALYYAWPSRRAPGDRDGGRHAGRDRAVPRLAELKGDREIVTEAVKQDGRALQYASAELKGDREIVMEAAAERARAARLGRAEGHQEIERRQAEREHAGHARPTGRPETVMSPQAGRVRAAVRLGRAEGRPGDRDGGRQGTGARRSSSAELKATGRS